VAVAERPLEDVARVADAFREPSSSLLMPPITEPLTPATVLDISHEALIRNWQTLKDWVREERGSASRYRETERRFHQQLIGEAPPWDAHELRAVLVWSEQERPNSAWAARYGGNFDQLLTSAKSAAVHQAKALWAGRLSLVVNTIGAIVDVTFFHAAPAVWLAMIGMIYGTVQRNLSRNFLAARSWAIMWAGVLAVLLIYSTYQQLQDHTMTMALGITMTTFTVVLLFLSYIYGQLRPLTLRRRAQSAAEPEFDPRRRRQARFALIATLVVLVITGVGQAIYGIVNQVYIPRDNSSTSLADAAASLVLAGVFYATTNRNLPRNLAFVRGAIGVWAFADLFALLNNITIGARALAAVDCAIALCLAFALISLMPGLRAVIGLRAGRNAFAARQARGSR